MNTKHMLSSLLMMGFCLMNMSCEKETFFVPGENEEEVIVDPDPDPIDKTHPFLFFDSEKGEELRQAMTTTAYNSMYNRVKSKSASWGAPTAYRPAETGEELYQRDAGSRLASFALLAYLDNSGTYYQSKCKEYAQVICNDYITWGKDSSSDGMEFGLLYGHHLLGLSMTYDMLFDELDDQTKAMIRTTILERARRQYAAYKNETHNMMTNHLWINCVGLLSAAIVLEPEVPTESAEWMTFVDGIFSKVSKFLQPDGVSPEGAGYWQYGMVYLIPGFEMMRTYNGADYTQNSTWWQNTGDYASYMMLPRNSWSSSFDLIDFADSRRYSWNGPEEIYRYLARLNQDPVMQWYADRISEYSQFHEWQNLLWFDPSVSTASNASKPLLKHFDDMDLVVARNNWSGDESLVAFKCGAPDGKAVHATEAALGAGGNNTGHTHPDANHFIVFANGEFIIKNNGYVKRRTIYHNTLLVDGYGQWGQKPDYWTPMENNRLSPAHDPTISKAETDTDGNIVIVGEAGNTYADEAAVTKYNRKFIYVPEKDAVIVYDDVALSSSKNIELRLFPESQSGILAGNVYTASTTKNNVRIENLTPTVTDILLTTENIEERGNTTTTPTDMITLSKNSVSSMQNVVVISWSKTGNNPNIGIYQDTGTEKSVSIDGKKIIL